MKKIFRSQPTTICRHSTFDASSFKPHCNSLDISVFIRKFILQIWPQLSRATAAKSKIGTGDGYFATNGVFNPVSFAKFR